MDQQIQQLEKVNDCFFYDSRDFETDKVNPTPVHSTKPQLIVEFDGPDGREKEWLPMELNNAFIDMIQNEISQKLTTLRSEFDKL